MDSSARRRGKHRVAPSPSTSPKAPVAGDAVRLYYNTLVDHNGRLAAAVVSLAIYPHWARRCTDSEREVQ